MDVFRSFILFTIFLFFFFFLNDPPPPEIYPLPLPDPLPICAVLHCLVVVHAIIFAVDLRARLNRDTRIAPRIAYRPAETERQLDRLRDALQGDRKSTRLNSSHLVISYAVFCLKKKKILTVNVFSTTEIKNNAKYRNGTDKETRLQRRMVIRG